MDEQEPVESAYASSSNDSDLDRPKGLDFDTGFRHILAPAIFGMIVGIFFQQYITQKYSWPSPPQGAILTSLILSPLLYFTLVRDEASRWYEYSLGLALPGLIFFMMWFSGWGALFCGGYGALLLWVWISTSWGRYELPPFRYGVWHAFCSRHRCLFRGPASIQYRIMMCNFPNRWGSHRLEHPRNIALLHRRLIQRDSNSV